MPQDGSMNYQYPPGTPGIPDTTIESESYNTFLDDLVVNDLNIARPVHRGGTGGNTAYEARQNLDVEVATQVVTNFDSHIFEAGSFKAAGTATGSPLAGEDFTGICHIFDSTSLFLEARTYADPPRRYFRKRQAAVWSAWTADNQVVGDITVSSGAPGTGAAVILNRTLPSVKAQLIGKLNNSYRWAVEVGDESAETGGNAGSNFNILRWGDAGVSNQLATPFSINRSTGTVSVGSGGLAVGNVSDGLHLIAPAGGYSRVKTTVTDGRVWTCGTWTDGSFTISDELSGGIRFQIGTVGNVIVHQSLNVYGQTVIGGNFICNGIADINNQLTVDSLICNSAMSVSGPFLNDYGRIMCKANGGQPTVSVWNQGGEPAYGMCQKSNLLYFLQVDGSGTPLVDLGLFNTSAHFQIFSGTAYKAGGGSWADSSDARIKNVLGDFTSGLDAISTLRPIKYTFKGNDTTSAPEARKTVDAENKIIESKTKDTPTVPYGNSPHYNDAVSGKEHIGLIAQEVEALFPELITKRSGMIDGQPVTDIRDLDTSPLIFALINAVKELKTRVEALEAA